VPARLNAFLQNTHKFKTHQPKTTHKSENTHKIVILSEALHRFIALHSTWARSRRTPRMLILSMLFGAFQPPKAEPGGSAAVFPGQNNSKAGEGKETQPHSHGQADLRLEADYSA
jgi:hypothetical protein